MNQHCKIFIAADSPYDLLIVSFEQKYHLKSDISVTLEGAFFEIQVRKNEDADSEQATTFPDGFLYFNYYVDVFFKEDLRDGQVIIDLLSDLLEWLWKSDYAAVASCDYENLLPENGGYKSEKIPWPGNC